MVLCCILVTLNILMPRLKLLLESKCKHCKAARDHSLAVSRQAPLLADLQNCGRKKITSRALFLPVTHEDKTFPSMLWTDFVFIQGTHHGQLK